MVFSTGSRFVTPIDGGEIVTEVVDILCRVSVTPHGPLTEAVVIYTVTTFKDEATEPPVSYRKTLPLVDFGAALVSGQPAA